MTAAAVIGGVLTGAILVGLAWFWSWLRACDHDGPEEDDSA